MEMTTLTMTTSTIKINHSKTIATFNCQSKTPHVPTIMNFLDLDILALTETWTSSPTQTDFHTIQLDGIQTTKFHRRSAGITLISRQKLISIKSINTPTLKAIVAISPDQTTFIGAYIPPLQSNKSVTSSIEKLTKYTRGKFCIIRDLNARHKQ